jgi:hypothetical protein
VIDWIRLDGTIAEPFDVAVLSDGLRPRPCVDSPKFQSMVTSEPDFALTNAGSNTQGSDVAAWPFCNNRLNSNYFSGAMARNRATVSL